MHPNDRGGLLRRLYQFVLIVALVMSGAVLPAATMPCCASSGMPAHMRTVDSPVNADDCHDASSRMEMHATSAMMTPQTADLAECEHVACAPAGSRAWKAESVEAHAPFLSVLTSEGYVTQRVACRTYRGVRVMAAADPGPVAFLPMRV